MKRLGDVIEESEARDREANRPESAGDRGFPLASRLAAEVRGESAEPGYVPPKRSAKPVRVSLATLKATLDEGGTKADHLISEAEYAARNGATAEDRRKGLLQLQSINLIKSGRYTKHFIESHPELLIDIDNDVYRPKEGSDPGAVIPQKGAYLDTVKGYSGIPREPAAASEGGMTVEQARELDMKEKAEAMLAYVREHPDEEVGVRRPPDEMRPLHPDTVTPHAQ